MHRNNIIIIAACLMLSSCKAAGNADRILARVNGEPIYMSELSLELKFELSKYDPRIAGDTKKVEEIKRALLESMIKDRILYVAAKNAGITMTDDELTNEYVRYKSRYNEAAFQKMLELKGIGYEHWKEERKRKAMADKLIQQQVVDKIDVTDDEIKRYYNKHRKEFSRGEEVRARQILVDDPQLAEQIRTKAEAGENFAALAGEYSIAPEGKRGGDLGWFPRGVMPKEFDEACFPLPVGAISPVVQSEFGYHIFKVIERRGPGSVKLQDVKEKIVSRIKQEKIEDAFVKWYEPIRKKAKVDVNEEVFKSIEAPKEIQ